ncbi:hypothetical protein HHK36_002128 [Tetracentron sinense]|uniref:DRBM domain-containing protein n=1 Tax=Tetracentron sinense TaxID=13715 RepID=A0A834ZUW3_TETSI|nr:hypothetical protein HHK36_002128 [Tetracentron sinense]
MQYLDNHLVLPLLFAQGIDLAPQLGHRLSLRLQLGLVLQVLSESIDNFLLRGLNGRLLVLVGPLHPIPKVQRKQEVEKEVGPAHNKRFLCSVQIETIDGVFVTSGDAKPRVKDAENSAASMMIRGLQDTKFKILLTAPIREREREMDLSKHRTGVLKGALVVMGLCLGGYILGPPLYWHLAAVSHSSSSNSCPPCICDCASQPFLSLPQGLSNTSFADCVKHDPEASNEMEKNFTELLSEELKLQEAETLENQQRADMALLEAKKMASQYQKEADKCNSGMETCEEAREKAEAALVAQKKLTAMWELRARQRGWKEGITKSQAES